MLLVIAALPLFAQADSTHIFDPSTTPLAGSGWQEWLSWAIGLILVIWEVIMRLVPSAKDLTIVSKIVSLLDWIAKLFNGVGNVTKTADGEKAKFVKTKVAVK